MKKNTLYIQKYEQVYSMTAGKYIVFARIHPSKANRQICQKLSNVWLIEKLGQPERPIYICAHVQKDNCKCNYIGLDQSLF